jgi:hypothetical protein
MPLVSLTFSLPEDEYRFTAARQGTELRVVLTLLDEYLGFKTQQIAATAEAKTYREIHDYIRAELHKRNIRLA